MRKQLSQDENKGSVGTLARGLDILELFAGESPELTQTEISDRLGLPVPTVHRLVKLLTERGWLVRDPATRRLRLGLGAARLLPAVRLPDLAREPLRALAERTGETANLATLDGGRGALPGQRDRQPPADAPLARGPAAAGARDGARAGACWRSWTTTRARAAAGEEPYEALTDRTITSWSKLRASLERMRREDVAYSREEYRDRAPSRSRCRCHGWTGDGPVAVNVSLPASRGGRKATAGLCASSDGGGRDRGEATAKPGSP